jgi:hypothetical protein
MGWWRLHIPSAKNREEFLQYGFDISRHRVRYFFKRGGDRDWFSLQLKLHDFTSGFQTSCADMAGGCEEAAAAGSWIGTGAGSGGKLNKYDEVDGDAEGK